MHLFYSKDPERCQVGQEIRIYDEVTRVRPDRYVIAYGSNMCSYLRRHGFIEVPVENLLSAKEAADALQVPVPVINAWARTGKLANFADSYLRSDVDHLAAEREAEAA